MKVFNVYKYINDSKERGIDERIINITLSSWALKSHDKLIDIDSDGNHWIKGTNYLSDELWENEVYINERRTNNNENISEIICL